MQGRGFWIGVHARLSRERHESHGPPDWAFRHTLAGRTPALWHEDPSAYGWFVGVLARLPAPGSRGLDASTPGEVGQFRTPEEVWSRAIPPRLQSAGLVLLIFCKRLQ